MSDLLPYRAAFGTERPPRLSALPLPPARMPGWRGGRPLKRWRYVACFDAGLMLCAADVHVGPARQVFWAVWDREAGVLHGHTRRRGDEVTLEPGVLRISNRLVEAEVMLEEQPGVEALWPHGRQYAWTRKQGGIAARGRVRAGGRELVLDLIESFGEPASSSERIVWVDGEPSEPAPVRFARDLSSVGELRFSEEARRARAENLVLVRSRYVQPFGTFTGALPGGPTLAHGLGVMERHEVWW